MKNYHLKVTYLLLSIMLFLFSCNIQETDSEKLVSTPEDLFNKSTIGILNSEGIFQQLDKESLNLVLKSNFDIDPTISSLDFQEFSIIEDLDEENNEIYHLTSRSIDGLTSISIKLREIDPGDFIITLDGCKCESTNCNGPFDCNASGSGSNCACSSCFNECKKTSTSGDASIAGP